MWDVRCQMWDLGIEEFGDFMEHGEKARKARKGRSFRIVKLSCCDLSVVSGPLSVARKA